jgi:LPXTG-motif cell wall-anchored protein
MKRFGLFLATSCLGITLAAAQETQPPPSQPQDQQTQQTQPGTQTQTTQTQTTQPAQQQPGAQDQQQLPRTASPMPLVGLAGVLSLAGAGLIRRLRRSAA